MREQNLSLEVLVLGGVWTLIGVALLAAFKSSSIEPIYLWALGVTALGWTAICLYALASMRRDAETAVASACGETRSAIDGLAEAMGAEMQRASSELLRVDDLLGHAIEQLMSAFNAVADQAASHQQDLEQAAAAAQGTPAAGRLRAAAERVTCEVNGAVTALQFRDVVGQKLGHVRLELNALEQLMQQIRALAAAPSADAATPARIHASSQAQFAAGVCRLLHELEQARATTPVRQELMHAGEVELF